MVKQAAVVSQLESIVGGEGILTGEFAVDGLTPQAAVAPDSYEQVAEVLRYAHAEGLAVIPWGSGTHIHIGNVPARYDIALSLARLTAVVEHEPADLTVTCQAGITLAALQRRLAEHGQLAPLGAAWDEGATIGGILAANVTGPSRHAYGSARDFTIGLRVVTAEGRLTKAGGRVVKNVAGYDLCKLYIGSLGTLGVIVEATFKLAPLPKAREALVAAFATAAEACAFAAELQRRGLSLRAVQLLTASAAGRLAAEDRWLLVLELAGTPRAVERTRKEVRELAGDGADLRGGDEAAAAAAAARFASPDGAVLLCKATALPTRLPSLIETVGGIDGAASVLAWPTVGVVYVSWARLDDVEGAIDRLRAAAAAAGGSLVVERCPLDLKRRLDVFGPPPAGFDLMRSVKQQFDPAGVLGPGRYLGRL